MPIDVVICADTRHVVIRITDLAGGIPRHVGSQIWSSLGWRNWVIGVIGRSGGIGEVVVKFDDLFLVDEFLELKNQGLLFNVVPFLRGF